MKNFFLFISLALIAFNTKAQDIHFSQYYANPLYMNPALTGTAPGDFRMTAQYRNQAFTISNNPYVTYSGSFDIAPFKKKMRYDLVGFGLLVYSDKTGNGVLRTQSVQLSGAFNKTLDAYKKYSLGIGIQGGIIQKRIDFTRLAFESQFDGDTDFDLALPSGENVNQNSFILPALNVGLLWKAFFSKTVNAYAGFSMNNLLQPRQTFLNDPDSRLSTRYLIHAAADFRMGKYATITPTLMFKSQNTAQQLNLGAAFGYDINDITTIFFGGWYRWKDAIIPTAAIEISGFRIGLSYDANISQLRPASRGHGAIEVSLIYVHKKTPPSYFNPSNFCPRM
jgi:type IX secretion system PorP/SprF family membrane protein